MADEAAELFEKVRQVAKEVDVGDKTRRYSLAGWFFTGGLKYTHQFLFCMV